MKVGRQRLELPFINTSDSRMTPNTFEAYILRGEVTELPWLEGAHYSIGWIDKIRRHTDTEFRPMSEAAGAEGTAMGVLAGGLAWKAGETVAVGAVNYFLKDTLNLFYIESDGLLEADDDLAFRLQLQGALQGSVGVGLLDGGEPFASRFESALQGGALSAFRDGVPLAEQLGKAITSALEGVVRQSGEPVDTWFMGGRLSGSLWGGTLAISATKVGPGAAMRSPFGTYPGFVDLMQSDFERANELAVVVGLSFVASELGLPELSGFVNYGLGVTARDPVEDRPLPNRQELDLTLDYKADEGLLRGFWFRVRGSMLHIDHTPRSRGRTRKELRFIVRYELPVL